MNLNLNIQVNLKKFRFKFKKHFSEQNYKFYKKNNKKDHNKIENILMIYISYYF